MEAGVGRRRVLNRKLAKPNVPATPQAVSEARSEAFVGMLGRMHIATDPATSAQALSGAPSMSLDGTGFPATQDAAYLDLALRAALPIAPLDDDPLRAAELAGVVHFAR